MKMSDVDEKGLETFQGARNARARHSWQLALWQALIVVAETDDRLRGVDYEHRIVRAKAQFAQIEGSRLLGARIAFP